ncbi:MAG: LytTR family DNA-binding domain-containing protein [Pseudomonadota bacterium]
MAQRILIVDDEPPAIERMTTLLGALPGYQVIGCESRSDRVIERCQTLKPDAVLLDIEMPGLDGLELAQQLNHMQPRPAVIFVTAYESYAVDAFGLAATDYLVKPVRLARLKQALDRLHIADADTSPQFINARVGDRRLRIALAKVRAFVAEEKSVMVHSTEGIAMMDDTLKHIEQTMGDRFFRVHRSALVSRVHIRGYRQSDGVERIEIEGIELKPEVSRRNRAELKRWLNQS